MHVFFAILGCVVFVVLLGFVEWKIQVEWEKWEKEKNR